MPEPKYPIFTDTSRFTKLKGKSCKSYYHVEDTLQRATEICKTDVKCKVFYSTLCTDEGPFRLCQDQFDLQDSDSESCAYLKKEKLG